MTWHSMKEVCALFNERQNIYKTDLRRNSVVRVVRSSCFTTILYLAYICATCVDKTI